MTTATQDVLAKKIKGIKFIKSYAGIDEYKLENGLKILLKPNTDSPLFSWQVWYKVGSRNEQPGLTGIAHYLEHIMFKGTKTFAKGEIAQAIQLRGGVFNAFTGDDYTAYFENFSPENLELAIKIEADRMQNSRLDGDEINLERSVIVSELEGNKNHPTSVLYENLRSNAYKVHTYKNPIIGWRKDLDRINDKNMREFYEKYYYPDNAVAILVGNFDSELALELIQKYFGQYKARANEMPVLTQEPEQEAEKRVYLRRGGHTKLLGMAFHVPQFTHEDSAALNIISDVVFQGMSSRLYPKLVDAGLVTSISGVSESSIDAGLFRIIVNLAPEADIEKVEKIIDAELEAVKKDISEDEINLAIAKEEASFVYQRDGAYDEGLQIGYFEALTNDWTKYIRWMDEIKAVTADDVKKVAKKYFKPNNKTVVQYLPEEATDVLVEVETEVKKEANYGAASVEPLSPEKLDHLMDITKAKYSKKFDFPRLDLKFNNITLGDNGVQLYHRADNGIPLIYWNTYLFAGTVNDGEKPGIAYLTAQMLERGSEKKDKYEISKMSDLYGADISFDTGRETTRIHFSTITNHLDEVVDTLNEILETPKFDPEELERLKALTISRLKQEDDNPARVAKRELTRIIYPEGHPYRQFSVEQRIEALKKLSIEDVKEYYSKHYNANNMLISVVGDIDEAKVIDIANNVFLKLNSSSAKPEFNQRPEIARVEIKDAQELRIVKEDKKQTEVILGHSGDVSRLDDDYYALLIANYALGGSALSSRLGTAVRDENGYVYNIRSSFGATLGAGAFQVILGANPANVDKAIELTKKVIQEYLDKGINETELKVTKSYLTGSFAARTLSSNEDISETLSQLQIYKLGDDYIKTYNERIAAITLEQVRDAARKYIQPEKLNAVIVGP